MRTTLKMADGRVEKDVVMPRAFEIPEKSAFIQQTNGGSLAVGLLLGPLGVMANVANIDRLTQEMGKSAAGSSLVLIDAKAEAGQAIGDRFVRPNTVAEGGAASSIQPYLVYYVANEQTAVDVLVQMRVELEQSQDGKPVKLALNYVSYLRDPLPMDALRSPLPAEKLESLRADVRSAYQELAAEMLGDLRQPPPPSRKIAWVSSRVWGVGGGGDIDKTASGKFMLRVRPRDNEYAAIIFNADSQYKIENGPVVRERR